MATAELSRIVSDFETSLSGAISIGATSFTIQSVTDLDGVQLSNGTYCFTIDRDVTGSKEYLVGQLDAATKTVSSVSSVSRQGALTANAQKAHRIGANVIISDHSILSAISRVFNGVDTIDPAAPLEYASAPTLSSATQIATKGYVDSVVTGGTVNSDRIILGSQTAGETIAEGDIIYFKSSDSRWWLADADLTATFQNVLLGVAQGAGTAGNAITDGVLIYGKSDNFSGLTATATYYLSNTAGDVSTSAGTFSIILGQAFSTTGIFFNPNTSLATAVATSSGSGDAGKIIKANSSGLLDNSFLSTTPTMQVFTSSGTWNKPSGLKAVIVEVVGGGGAGKGVTATDGEGGGGGAGGYSKKRILAASLGSTETVTVGAGGTGSTGNGTSGGNSSFGSHCTANGGSGATSSAGASGGSASNGDINISGGDGSSASGDNAGGSGGNTVYGFGGSGGAGNNGGSGGKGYGGGGGGADATANSADQSGGGGAGGIVIVTEYYN